DDALPSTLANLQSILGIGNNVQGVYRGLAVRLLPESNPGQLPQVNYSFSGATDSTRNYATLLHSNVHLRLQPFIYAQPEQIQFYQADGRTIDLTQQPEVRGQAFAQMGYYIEVPDQIDWNRYLNDPNLSADQKRRIRVLKYILTNQSPQGQKVYDVLFTYGIHTLEWRDGTNGHTNAIGSHPTD